MEIGWVKLHRKIQSSEIWSCDPKKEPFDKRSAWIDLILEANHEKKTIVVGCSSLTVDKGQKLTSLRKLAGKWGWSYNKVSRYLNLLEELEMISKSETLNGTLITVKNYSKYQGIPNENKEECDTSCDTSESTDVTREGHERMTNKKYKNIKNDKEEKKENDVLTDEEEMNRILEMLRNQ